MTDTIKGVVSKKTVNICSKSEHEAYVISYHGDNGRGHIIEDLEIKVAGANPFELPAGLEDFVGKYVEMTGTIDKTAAKIEINSVDNIIVTFPTGARPPKKNPNRKPPGL